MTIQITKSNDVPDSTYFRTGDAEPDVNETGITLYNGQGSRRNSWGAPQVTSTVLVDLSNFVAVHIGFSHKHGGGQFYRYYFQPQAGAPISQLTWAQLSGELQAEVFKAYQDKAPSWAKAPGTVRAGKLGKVAEKLIQYDPTIIEIEETKVRHGKYDVVL